MSQEMRYGSTATTTTRRQPFARVDCHAHFRSGRRSTAVAGNTSASLANTYSAGILASADIQLNHSDTKSAPTPGAFTMNVVTRKRMTYWTAMQIAPVRTRKPKKRVSRHDQLGATFSATTGASRRTRRCVDNAKSVKSAK